MPSQATPSPAPGRYTRVCELARGGMGYVELVVVREARFERLYARKRLHTHLRAEPRFREMFMDEARLAGLVRHPNVVSVLDVGEDDDGPFLIMDYVEGVPAADVVARASGDAKALPVQLCTRIALEVARGLHAAHELRSTDGRLLGLVHRDVSPQNILIGMDGSVRVTDFGIAKAFGNAARTNADVLKGTVGYLSPEQLRFEEPDRRSDLFALGVSLYELLSGARLYDAPSASETLRRILNEPPPDIGAVRGDVPAELVELLFELLAKDRDDRPPDAEKVALRLEAILAALVADEGAVDLATYMRATFGTAFLARKTEVTAALAALATTETRRSRPRRWWPVAAGAVVATVAAIVVLRAQAPAPSAVPGAGRTVFGGGWHTCAITAGRLSCWGKNHAGQLGFGDTLDRPVRVPIHAAGDTVSAGPAFRHTCSCDRQGRLHCWGDNRFRQLGVEGESHARPVVVPGVSACVQVSARGEHTCVLRRDGTVLCWGRNEHGESGVAPSPFVDRPTPVAGVAGVVEVAAGVEFTCARTAAGAVLCWGKNDDGQLGTAPGPSRHAPAPVPGVAAVEIAAGRRLVCARTADGAVLCWGYAGAGDAKGPPDGTRPPTRMPGLPAAVQLAAGYNHACALTADGRIWCWGANAFGQLGDGTISRVRMEPAPVKGIDSFLDVTAGEVHTCGRHAAGIACWGHNETGQLGDGTTEDRYSPVSAAGFAR